ncbi:hypothetical protein Cyast_1115 [Cyanobacterium stanieri PCC 7202]|uniref:ADP-ribosylation/Crystallin J1 n=1 Tax=Cyanobacterium stanieri (strain ATCC 29140 / PCC 7202) TaxID=292563 RepID=K9YJM9_CYASC|nr:hypothetical protein Cyast_1115 [Cyanobacterium stanieri PCC 7202]
MPYFHQSSFKGALWGAVSGDYFSQNSHDCLFLNHDLNSFAPSLELAFVAIQNIVKNQAINIKDLLLDWDNNHYSFNILTQEQRAIALIPLILYCYENPHKLEKYLQQIATELKMNDFNNQSIFDLRLIFQIILEKQSKFTSNKLLFSDSDKLKKIFYIYQEKLSIEDVQQQINNCYGSGEIAIYQAIYNFISLPDYVELSLLRSTHFEHHKQSTAILTGCLLGLNNGYHSLPLSWRKYLQLIPLVKDRNIEQISKAFVDTWEGKYTKNPLLQT